MVYITILKICISIFFLCFLSQAILLSQQQNILNIILHYCTWFHKFKFPSYKIRPYRSSLRPGVQFYYIRLDVAVLFIFLDLRLFRPLRGIQCILNQNSAVNFKVQLVLRLFRSLRGIQYFSNQDPAVKFKDQLVLRLFRPLRGLQCISNQNSAVIFKVQLVLRLFRPVRGLQCISNQNPTVKFKVQLVLRLFRPLRGLQ